MVRELTLFLEGNQDAILKRLQESMNEAAQELRFEDAAKYRDQAAAVKRVLEKQTVVSLNGEDQDVVALARGVTEACVQVFQVRAGKLLSRETFFLKGAEGYERPQLLAAFLKDYYSRTAVIPPRIILAEEAEERELLAAYLSRRKGRVVFMFPSAGEGVSCYGSGKCSLALQAEGWAQQVTRTEEHWRHLR